MEAEGAQALSTVGCEVTVQTKDGEEVKGVVFGSAFDGPNRVVVLQQPGSTPFHNGIRILKQDYIKDVSNVRLPESDAVEALPQVDEKRSRDREDRAVRAAELDAAKIGEGVSEDAQAVFDAMSKTLPCKWVGTTIEVVDTIHIKEPYGPDDCTSMLPDDQAGLDRVKKVLVAERAKLFGAN